MNFWYAASRWIFVTLAALGFLLPGLPVQAQKNESIHLAALEIALWPEFDRSELLVIFQGRLADDVSLPTDLTITMPKEAGEPHAVASVNKEGQRLTAAYDVRAIDDTIEITYTSLQDRAFQFEYYINLINIDGDLHQFTYSYRLDIPVDDFTLELQQPAGAANLLLEPIALETYTGFGNLIYHALPLGSVEKGVKLSWRVSYDKSTTDLSIDTISTGSPASSEPTAGPASFDISVGTMFAVGAALVLAVGAFWIAGSRRQSASRRHSPSDRTQRPIPPKPKSKRSKKGTQPRSAQKTPRALVEPAAHLKPLSYPEGKFCHKCGTQLQADAIFCPHCGTKRKGM